jgi:hypothetical protein
MSDPTMKIYGNVNFNRKSRPWWRRSYLSIQFWWGFGIAIVKGTNESSCSDFEVDIIFPFCIVTFYVTPY